MLKRMVSPLVLALALSGGTAWAVTDQEKSSSAAGDQQTAASPSASSGSSTQLMSGQSVLTADEIMDMKVVGSSGETIGEVEDMVVDSSGRISGVVVSVGGFLGIGDKKVSLPWNQLQFTAEQDKLTTSATKQQLEQAAAWQDPDEQTAAGRQERKSGAPATGGTTTPPPSSTTR